MVVAKPGPARHEGEQCGWDVVKIIDIPPRAYFQDYSGASWKGNKVGRAVGQVTVRGEWCSQVGKGPPQGGECRLMAWRDVNDCVHHVSALPVSPC
jgi:hypothetical protein